MWKYFSGIILIIGFVSSCTSQPSLYSTSTPIATSPPNTAINSSIISVEPATVTPTLTATNTQEPTPTVTASTPQVPEPLSTFCEDFECEYEWDAESWQLLAMWDDEQGEKEVSNAGVYTEKDGVGYLKFKTDDLGEEKEYEIPVDNLQKHKYSKWWWSRLAPKNGYGEQVMYARGEWHTVEVGPTEAVTPSGINVKITRNPHDLVYFNEDGGLDTLDKVIYMTWVGFDPTEKTLMSVTTEEIIQFRKENPTIDGRFLRRAVEGEEADNIPIHSTTAARAGKMENVRTDEILINLGVVGESGKMMEKIVNVTKKPEDGGAYISFIQNDDGTNTMELNAVEYSQTDGSHWTDYFIENKWANDKLTVYDLYIGQLVGSLALEQSIIANKFRDDMFIRGRVSKLIQLGKLYYDQMREMPLIFGQGWIDLQDVEYE